MMHVAMRMHEHMGFVHAPELDSHVDKDLTVKGVV
jgi:hypothetical protein